MDSRRRRSGIYSILLDLNDCHPFSTVRAELLKGLAYLRPGREDEESGRVLVIYISVLQGYAAEEEEKRRNNKRRKSKSKI